MTLIEKMRETFWDADGGRESDAAFYAAAKAMIDDMREALPEHPPLRGPIQAWLDAYEKALEKSK